MTTINKIDSLIVGAKYQHKYGNGYPYGYGESIDSVFHNPRNNNEGNGRGAGICGNIHEDGDEENPLYLIPYAKEEYQVFNYGKYQNSDGIGEGC